MRFSFLLRGAMVLCFLAAAAPARGQHVEVAAAFDEGNRQYLQGRYEAALQAYERVLDAGFASGALYYNMGNAYYRLDRLGQAIRYYEKARRLLPDSPELAHNLELARSRTVDQFSQLPTPFWVRWWHRLVRTLGAGWLFAAGLLCYLAAAALAGHRIWTGARSAWIRRTLTGSLLLGLLLLTLAFAASLGASRGRTAVVVAEATTLQQAPTAEAEAAREVHEGAMLDVLRAQGPWLEVRLPNGVRGWIAANAVADV